MNNRNGYTGLTLQVNQLNENLQGSHDFMIDTPSR